MDYKETIAPVAKNDNSTYCFAVVASRGWSLREIDVKNAFSHGDLKEKIYMTLPTGLFSFPSSNVHKLKCSLYG